MNKNEALREMRIGGRDVIAKERAKEIAQAFDVDIESEGGSIVVERPSQTFVRARIWNDSPSVAMYALAERIAVEFVPTVNIGSCPYSGAGKSAEWATSQYCKVIEGWMQSEVTRICAEIPEPVDFDHSRPHEPTDRQRAIAEFLGLNLGVQPEEATFIERFGTTDAGYEERIFDAEQAAKEAMPDGE